MLLCFSSPARFWQKNTAFLFRQFEKNAKIEPKLQRHSSQKSPRRKRTSNKLLSPTAHAETLKLYHQAQEKNLPVSGKFLKTAARRFAHQEEIAKFTASNGWISRFKTRNKLSFKEQRVEAARVDKDGLDAWYNGIHKLPEILLHYSLVDVFNADEAGLAFKQLHRETLMGQGKSFIDWLIDWTSDGSNHVSLWLLSKYSKFYLCSRISLVFWRRKTKGNKDPKRTDICLAGGKRVGGKNSSTADRESRTAKSLYASPHRQGQYRAAWIFLRKQ